MTTRKPDDPAPAPAESQPAESPPAQPAGLSPMQRLERCEKAVNFCTNYMFSVDELLRELVARVAALETSVADGVQGMLTAGDKLREVIEKAKPEEKDDADFWKTGDHDG